MNKNLIRSILLLIITAFIFFLIFSRIDLKSVIQVLSKANPTYLLFSILILPVIFLVSVKRWQIILKIVSQPVPFGKCFNIFMAALPLTSITPSKSGDLVKAYYLKNEIPISKTIGTVLTERVFDLLSLLLLSIVGSIYYFKIGLLIIFIPALMIVLSLFVIPKTNVSPPFIKDSWNNKLKDLMLSFRLLSRKEVIIILMFSFSIWILSVIQMMLFFYTLNIDITFISAMTNMPIAIFIGFIPVTLGGMGTRDAAIILLFSGYATPTELLGVGILFSLVRYWIPSLLGIPFMYRQN